MVQPSSHLCSYSEVLYLIPTLEAGSLRQNCQQILKHWDKGVKVPLEERFSGGLCLTEQPSFLQYGWGPSFSPPVMLYPTLPWRKWLYKVQQRPDPSGVCVKPLKHPHDPSLPPAIRRQLQQLSFHITVEVSFKSELPLHCIFTSTDHPGAHCRWPPAA